VEEIPMIKVAIFELRDMIKALQKEIETLKAEVRQLDERTKKLEKDVQQLQQMHIEMNARLDHVEKDIKQIKDTIETFKKSSEERFKHHDKIIDLLSRRSIEHEAMIKSVMNGA